MSQHHARNRMCRPPARHRCAWQEHLLAPRLRSCTTHQVTGAEEAAALGATVSWRCSLQAHQEVVFRQEGRPIGPVRQKAHESGRWTKGLSEHVPPLHSSCKDPDHTHIYALHTQKFSHKPARTLGVRPDSRPESSGGEKARRHDCKRSSLGGAGVQDRNGGCTSGWGVQDWRPWEPANLKLARCSRPSPATNPRLRNPLPETFHNLHLHSVACLDTQVVYADSPN